FDWVHQAHHLLNRPPTARFLLAYAALLRHSLSGPSDMCGFRFTILNTVEPGIPVRFEMSAMLSPFPSGKDSNNSIIAEAPSPFRKRAFLAAGPFRFAVSRLVKLVIR